MAQAPGYVLNIYEDDFRWEEEKYLYFTNPNYFHDHPHHNNHSDVNTPNQSSPNRQSDVSASSDVTHQKGEGDHPASPLSVKDPEESPSLSRDNRDMKPRRTLIRKEGQSNIAFRGIQKKRVRYLKDLYITLLDLKWRWAVLILFSGFFICYLVFSIIYYLLSYSHGDFENVHDPDFQPCIENLESYWDALLFSIETQSTIGYGTIYPNAECGGTVPVVFVQITVGFLLETLLLGFIFVKIARPKHRRHTLVFSRNACLCKEDSAMTLQVRVGDMRNTHLIDTHVYGVLVKRYVSEEKYVYPLFQHEIEFEAHGMGNRVFLIWPMVLRHKITSHSPLYTLKPEDLLYDKFELVIFLEGVIESTGEMVQARTSYTSKEILWGHRFTRLEEYDESTDRWCMDFVRFNNVLPSKTPRCSAQQADDTREGSADDTREGSADDTNENGGPNSPVPEDTLGVEETRAVAQNVNASLNSITSDAASYSTASEVGGTDEHQQ